MTKKPIIVFDFDGVLFDTLEFMLSNAMARYSGMTREIHNELLMGNEYEKMKKTEQMLKKETPEEREAASRRYLEEKSMLPMFPGMKELLGELQSRGYVLTMNTSAVAKTCRPLLEREAVGEMFDFIVTKEASTSKIEKFHMIATRYGVEPRDLLFITDTLGDLRESDRAGIPTIAVTWGGAHDRSYFTREPHPNLVAIVDTVPELRDRLLAEF